VLKEAGDADIEIMVAVGMSLDSSEECIKLAKAHKQIIAAAGIHPWNAVSLTEDIENRFRTIVKQDEVLMLAEIGLDFGRFPETKDIQKELLEFELSIAIENRLPVNIHCRDAHKEMMSILSSKISGGLRGIIHNFVGDMDMLKDWLDAGFDIAIGGAFLVSDLPALEKAIPYIPAARLVTETDATSRPQSANPADVTKVVEKLATIRGVTARETGNRATENLKTLLNI